MTRRHGTLALVLGVALGAPAAWAAGPIPASGTMVTAGQRLEILPDGQAQVVPSKRPPGPVVTTMKDLTTKPPKGLLRLERNRQYYRNKALKGRTFGTLLKGGLTEVLYKHGRKKAEKK